MKVKTILVSQPQPKAENSPYFNLVDKLKVKSVFRPFIHVEGVDAKDIRKEKVDLNDYTAIILTSRNAVDHYFRIAEEMRFKVPDDMKYFCLSEAIAFYLQKYVVYRKRRIYVGKRTVAELTPMVKKHKDEKFLFPTTDKVAPEITEVLDQLNIQYRLTTFYRTVISDLSDLSDVSYDILVFFSPSGIESLFHNFPDFEQKQTRLAVYGSTTLRALEERGLRADIVTPSPENPSMTMALEKYILEANKR